MASPKDWVLPCQVRNQHNYRSQILFYFFQSNKQVNAFPTRQTWLWKKPQNLTAPGCNSFQRNNQRVDPRFTYRRKMIPSIILRHPPLCRRLRKLALLLPPVTILSRRLPSNLLSISPTSLLRNPWRNLIRIMWPYPLICPRIPTTSRRSLRRPPWCRPRQSLLLLQRAVPVILWLCPVRAPCWIILPLLALWLRKIQPRRQLSRLAVLATPQNVRRLLTFPTTIPIFPGSFWKRQRKNSCRYIIIRRPLLWTLRWIDPMSPCPFNRLNPAITPLAHPLQNSL